MYFRDRIIIEHDYIKYDKKRRSKKKTSDYTRCGVIMPESRNKPSSTKIVRDLHTPKSRW